MSDEIIKVLDALAEKFGLAVDWTSSNVLPYISELVGKIVRWEIGTSIMWLVIGFIFLFSLIPLIGFSKYAHKKFKEDTGSDWDIAKFFIVLAAVVCGIIGIVMSICQIYDIITCYTFPEKILLDFINNYI